MRCEKIDISCGFFRCWKIDISCGKWRCWKIDTIKEFIKYVFVGGCAFVADWLVLFLLGLFNIHYLIATPIGFVFGLLVNFVLAKLIVFREDAKVDKKTEFFIYALIGAVGLLFTEGLMYVFTEWIKFHPLISKVFAAGIVLTWNYVAKKLILYKG